MTMAEAVGSLPLVSTRMPGGSPRGPGWLLARPEGGPGAAISTGAARGSPGRVGGLLVSGITILSIDVVLVWQEAVPGVRQRLTACPLSLASGGRRGSLTMVLACTSAWRLAWPGSVRRRSRGSMQARWVRRRAALTGSSDNALTGWVARRRAGHVAGGMTWRYSAAGGVA